MELSNILILLFCVLAITFSIVTVIRFIRKLMEGTVYVFDYLLGIFIFLFIGGFSIYGIIVLLNKYNLF